MLLARSGLLWKEKGQGGERVSTNTLQAEFVRGGPRTECSTAGPIFGAPFRYSNSAHPHACALCFFAEGLPPHLAFLAQNNTDNGNMQPIDEERGLVRTHSLVKGGSLANRHGPHRSPLSRQPSLQNDDPEKPWLAVSTGLGDWGTDRGGPLGEVRRSLGIWYKKGWSARKRSAPLASFIECSRKG